MANGQSEWISRELLIVMMREIRKEATRLLNRKAGGTGRYGKLSMNGRKHYESIGKQKKVRLPQHEVERNWEICQEKKNWFKYWFKQRLKVKVNVSCHKYERKRRPHLEYFGTTLTY